MSSAFITALVGASDVMLYKRVNEPASRALESTVITLEPIRISPGATHGASTISVGSSTTGTETIVVVVGSPTRSVSPEHATDTNPMNNNTNPSNRTLSPLPHATGRLTATQHQSTPLPAIRIGVRTPHPEPSISGIMHA